MKLYTEEQVKQIQQAILCNHKDAIMDANYCLSVTTPIEIPSDEEIDKANGYAYWGKPNGGKYIAFNDGAKWMRNKIQGGKQ